LIDFVIQFTTPFIKFYGFLDFLILLGIWRQGEKKGGFRFKIKVACNNNAKASRPNDYLIN